MKLSNEIAVFVPSTIGAAEASQEMVSRVVDQALIELSAVNGGATATNGVGAWLSSEGGLVKESVVIVSSSCETITLETLRTLAKLRRLVRKTMRQEAVTVRVNGVLYIR